MLQPCSMIILTLLLVSVASSQQQCPPWFIPVNTSTGESCLCDEVKWNKTRFEYRSILCTPEGKLNIYAGYCLSYNGSDNSLVAGACPFSLYKNFSFLTVPENVSKLEDEMCAPFHRRGLLCGECVDQQQRGPAISRAMPCRVCNVKLGWLKYLAMQIVPSTLLFFLIMIFNVQFSKSPINAFVFVCQVISNVAYYDAQLYSQFTSQQDYSNAVYILVHIQKTFYGIFNLDFHYLVYSELDEICISASMKDIHILIIKYFEAVNPLILILIVYLCILLYNKNFKPFVFAWYKLKTLPVLKRYTRNCSSKPITTAFISFIILAYSKIIFVSVNILIPNRVLFIKGTTAKVHWSLYFDPTISYFEKEHILYAILALLMLCIFVIFPLFILLLYPFRPFAAICRRTLRSHWHTLSYYMDDVQGWYRNGTSDNAPFDYRFISIIYPLLIILTAVWTAVFAGIVYRGSRIWIVPSMVLQGTGLFIALFRPYRADPTNKYSAVLMWLLGTVAFTMVRTGKKLMYFTLVLLYIPLIGAVVYISIRFFHWVRGKQLIAHALRCCGFRCTTQNEPDFPPLLSNARELHCI